MKMPNWLNAGRLMAPETEVGNGSGNPSGGGDPKGPKDGDPKITIDGKDYTPDQAKAFVSLHNALSDPDTAREIVTTMASRMGLLKADGTPKDSVTPEKVEKLDGRLTKALKQKLGKDYAQFADLVGGTLDEEIAKMFSEHSGKVTEELTQQQWNDGVEKFMGNVTVTDDVAKIMEDLITEAPPNTKAKSFDQQRYMNRMYKLACEEAGVKPTIKGRNTDEEGRDIIPRIRIADRPTLAQGGDPLDRAIDAAMNGIRFRS